MSINKNLLIPLTAFVLLVIVLAFGFRLEDPHYLPSELIDRPFPEFSLKDLHDPGRTLTAADIKGEISLVNVWATWCPNCLVEHPELIRISQEEGIALYGVNYNDESSKAIAWLERHGNPYKFNMVDDNGTLAIDLGVYGAPETFVLDKHGVIQYRHVGAVTRGVWKSRIFPVVELLQTQMGEG
ncbi:MAG: DsbE family thiol:disulfide interchange protein [Gammaproteobacteria bacterium]|jgi:cytochrome c biogenesis protein CcmG/thiol:disulfide interchange protein DsbE|nr:DsbE family thiol:disulfide interchange protein [Gammaproteobacteria bacterium]|tara:strand:+ start:1704 stop:2255 length:552 start_codon:yes stop_codon:yes gene_type:complete